MKHKYFKNLMLCCFFIFGVLTMNAQNGIKTKNIKFNKSHSIHEAKQLIKKSLNLSTDDDLVKVKTVRDKLGFSHQKFQQYFKGVKVEFGTYKVHAKNGIIRSMSGELFSAGKLNISPSISKQSAFNKVLSHVGAKKYMWQNPQEATFMGYNKPQGELVILPVIKGVTETSRLAYKFDIYAKAPLYRADVYIDAHTGKILFENNKIHLADTPATGTSLYNGTVSFTADSFNGSYRLRQTTDGNGIQTFDMKNGTSYTNASEVTSNSTSFTNSATAVQAHWGAEKTHKYYLQTHNRNSFDNNGGIIKSYVSYSTNYVNAYWNGSVMTYGDGDGVTYGPLVSLDIVGHEITHGVTERSANLVYSNESGALNESFSDIFGESIEAFAQASNDWLMGEQIGVGGSGGALRSMSNPNAFGDPDTYQGTNWATGTADNGGVHTNSGVQNFWYYILSVGKSGTNDNGNAYTVNGIGMTKASKIAYRNLTVYLSANSTYTDARTGAIQAAVDLYGAGSAEEIATTNAWYAVGVGAEYVQTCALGTPTNLASSAIGNNGFTLTWNAVTGAGSYTVTVGGTTATVNGTSYTATGLNQGTAYACSVAANCTTGGSGTVSTLSVTTTGSAPVTYCASKSTNTNDEYIQKVQLNTINNTSGAQFYSDFTAISTSLDKGTQYTITVTPKWTATVWSEGYSVWIDYNHDGDFADAGEQVFSKTASKTTPVSGTFTVPATATSGNTRMRVSMKYNAIPTACETFTYGEVEDYTINIVSAVADTTAPVIALNGAATINLNVGDTYTEQGATATDNVDGNITANIVISGTVNTAIAGTYSVNYNVNDAAGNAATQVTRTVIVSAVSTSGCTGGIASFPYTESFENTLGAWTQATGDNFDWTIRSGGTPSSNTGPTSASSGTYYVYMESSSPNNPSKRAILNSPCFDLSAETQATFTFKYHMFGATTMGSLALEASTDNGTTWTSVWSKSGNQGNSWLSASVDLATYLGSTVKLRFNGITGTTWQGDMAVDNVSLTNAGGGTGGGTCSNINLSITFDNYPSETSWKIVDGAGATVYSGGTYGSQTGGSTLNIAIGCLPNGCYDFIMLDTYGDGICCTYGNGSYTLTNSTTGATLASGGSFTSSNTTNFCLTTAVAAGFGANINTSESDNVFRVGLFPNPVTGKILNVRTTMDNITYTITNMIGQRVARGMVINNVIDVNTLKKGVYMIELSNSKEVITKKFVKK